MLLKKGTSLGLPSPKSHWLTVQNLAPTFLSYKDGPQNDISDGEGQGAMQGTAALIT